MLTTLIESDVTDLDSRERLTFRGRNVVDLAEGDFETAVNALWQQPRHGPWPPVPAAWEAAVAHGVPAQARHRPDLGMFAVLAAATADENREELAAEHVLAVARAAIRLAVRALGGPARESPWV